MERGDIADKELMEDREDNEKGEREQCAGRVGGRVIY